MITIQTVQPKSGRAPIIMPCGNEEKDYVGKNEASPMDFETRGVSDDYSDEISDAVDRERERVHAIEERLRGGMFQRKRV